MVNYYQRDGMRLFAMSSIEFR